MVAQQVVAQQMVAQQIGSLALAVQRAWEVGGGRTDRWRRFADFADFADFVVRLIA